MQPTSERDRVTKVAYLTNQYPMTSHSFIRREIRAVEQLGIVIQRFSIRCTRDGLVDPGDVAEADQTTVILKHRIGITLRTVLTCLRQPVVAARTLAIAWQLGNAAGKLPRHAVYFAEACWLATELHRQSIDHVHVHFGTNSATVMLLANMLSGVPFSITVHGPEEFDSPAAISLPAKIRAATFVAGVSSFGRSQLYRWCPLADWDKIQVIHCGLGEDSFSVASDEEDLDPGDSKAFVCVGRLCEQKGQLLLVQAAVKLHRRGHAFRLVLVGDGPMRKDLEKLIHQENLGESVDITGWRSGDEVKQHLAKCRAMVLPSFAEGLPVAIMEAMALRRPVISTYIAGIPELVTPDCGWLVPPGSVDLLVAAMESCLTADASRLAEIGEAAFTRVRRRHHIDEQARKLKCLFTRKKCTVDADPSAE